MLLCKQDKPSFVKQVNAVEDITTLRRLLIEKERERASIANDLDVAARLGLVISETNEAIKMKVNKNKQQQQKIVLIYEINFFFFYKKHSLVGTFRTRE